MRTRLRRTQKSQLMGLAVAGVLAAATLTSVSGTADAATAPPRTTVTVASFNVLGSSHTRTSTRYATGVERMGNVVSLLATHHIEVVGFQELQADQRQSFLDRTAGAFGIYSPSSIGPHGRVRVDSDNSIAWNATKWQFLVARPFTIPYFDGHPRTMPVVKLQNLRTGMTAWFANFHTPATNRQHPNSDPYRAQAIHQIAALAVQLRRDGIPVIFTGDMNERAKVFCALTGDAPMRAARGGTNRNGVCNPMHPWYVDWIFGLKRQQFSNYVEDRGALDRLTSDHPVIAADALMDPAKFPQATKPVVTTPAG